MRYRVIIFTFLLVIWPEYMYSQWIDISGVSTCHIQTEEGGPLVEISFELNCEELSAGMPAYIFIRYTVDNGKSWQLLDKDYLNSNGPAIFSSSGKKKINWWGSGERGVTEPEIKIRGLQMVRIPAGNFNMMSMPAGGKDPSISKRPDTNLPEFYIARNETTIAMYADYLNEAACEGFGWNPRMADSVRCGIRKTGSSGDIHYEVIPGKENYPVTYVSWYDAVSFLRWCGLTLPTEAMWEKAYVGGYYLDGDESGQVANPLPDRKYPWGNEVPYEGNVFRCNFDRDRDGYEFSSPVGAYSEFASPYGVNDLAGNVAEWTLDWYSTEYHTGLDGFRMVRGGSWLAMPVAVDAVSGATQFPIKESGLMGFRGVKID